MTGIRLIGGHAEVTAYMLARPALQHGGVVPDAAVLLHNNTSANRCAVALHVRIDGRDHFVKLSLDMLQTVAETMRAMAVEQYGEHRKL